jgi:hypothetical protein
MPLTFEALKGQRFRWCFGGIQILRRHWRLMMPGARSRDNQMSVGQRWAYFSGALQWYGDLLALLFFVFLLVGAANVGSGGGLLFRKLTGFLLAAIPLLFVLGLVRAVALLRRGTGAHWRDALGAFMIWQSTGLVVARASVQALFAKEAEFLRTPKTAEDTHWWTAIRGNLGETALAVMGIAGIIGALARASGRGGWLTAALLVWPTMAYAAAPLNSLGARRAALPADLRERRRSESQRYGTARRATLAAGGLVGAGATAAIVVALLSPGTNPILTPALVGPAQGHKVNYAKPSTSPTPTPSTSPTANASHPPTPASSPTRSTPTATPTPTPTATPTRPAATPTASAPPPSPTPTSSSGTP